MIWIFVTLVVLAYAMVFALCRAASLGDRREERYEPPLLTYSDEPRIHVVRGPYDHEAGGDFDD